jgi:hypothetical protein
MHSAATAAAIRSGHLDRALVIRYSSVLRSQMNAPPPSTMITTAAATIAITMTPVETPLSSSLLELVAGVDVA